MRRSTPTHTHTQGSHNRANGANSYGVAWHTPSATPGTAVGLPTSVIRVHYSDVARKNNADAAIGELRYLSGGAVDVSGGTTTSHHSTASALGTGGTIRDRNNAMVKSLQYAVVSTSDSHAIVRVDVVDHGREARSGGCAPPERDQLYQFFDEQYLNVAKAAMGWPRDKGTVELIPIVVGMGVVE
jgi:hypothetical protein